MCIPDAVSLVFLAWGLLGKEEQHHGYGSHLCQQQNRHGGEKAV